MPSGLFTEWLSYVRGEHHEKQLRSLIISGAFFAVVIAFNQRWFQFNWIITVFAALIILFIAQLKYGRMQHYAQFEKSFPEAIALVSTAVASGHSMHHAIERCGRELDGVLGTEFNRISRRLNLGELPQAVFSDAWQRFRYPEFYFFSIVALLSMQRGGQITELIKRLGRTMAANKAMQRRKAAMTAESRFTVKLLAAVPVLVMMGMKMLAPENFDFLLADNGGRLILWYVAIS